MEKTEKAAVISSIKDLFTSSTGVFLVDYSGINVEDISELRNKFREEGVTYKVFKNSLVNRAIEEVEGFDELKDRLVGMTGFGFTGENYVSPYKIIKDYHKDKDKLNFKGCYIESQFYDETKLDILASMPTKDEVMASIVGSIAAPASGIVGSLNAVIRDLVSVIDEAGKTKAA